MTSRNQREGHYIGHVWGRHVRAHNRPGGPWSSLAAVRVYGRGVERGTIRVRGWDADGDPVSLDMRREKR